MIKKTKGIISALIILLILYFGAVMYVESKIKNYIAQSEIFETKKYGSFDISLLSGGIDFFDIHLENKNQKIVSNALKISDISYFDFLIHNKITIDKIKIDNVALDYQLSNKKQLPNTENKTFQENITINEFIIDAKSVVLQKDQDTVLQTDSLYTAFKNIHIDTNTLQKQIPFTYDSINFSVTNCLANLNKVHKVKFSKLQATTSTIKIDSLAIIPLYSKADYIYQFQYQNDRYNLAIDEIVVKNYTIKNNDSLQISADKLRISKADLEIYLNAIAKPKEDKIKPLYSKQLRNLPFNLHIATTEIKDTKITYEELSNKDRASGIVFFTNLNATINHVANRRKFYPKNTITNVDITTQFMGLSKLDVQWNFDVGNNEDTFHIKGGMENLPQKSLNSFAEPASGVKFIGTINKLYFNFYGNNYSGGGDYLLAYDDLEIQLLDKENDKKPFLGWLANIFINSKNKNIKKGIKVENVKRDQLSSFWNFFWLMNKEGLTNTLL